MQLLLFEHTRAKRDIDDSIGVFAGALERSNRMAPKYLNLLRGYSEALNQRFNLTGDKLDIEKAITAIDKARESLSGDEHRELDMTLAEFLFCRFKILGIDRKGLEKAIELGESVISHQIEPQRCEWLNKHTNHLRARFKAQGNRTDLEITIAYIKNALEITFKDIKDFKENI